LKGENMPKLLLTILKWFGLATLSVGGVAIAVTCLCFFGIIGIWVWPYTLNTWLIFAGKTAKVLWWHGFLLGVCPPLGMLGIFSAIITWIAMLFLM